MTGRYVPSIQDRRDRETVVRPSYQKRRARVSSERNGETTSSRRLLLVEEEEEEYRLLAKPISIVQFHPSSQFASSPLIFALTRRARKRERNCFWEKEREKERKSKRVSPEHRLIRTLALLYRTHIYIYVYSLQPFLIRREEILIGEESRHRDHDREVFFFRGSKFRLGRGRGKGSKKIFA